jgi:magnesium transporter
MTAELWIDIAHPTQERLQGLGLHPLIIDDILKGGQRTKVERYDQTLFFVFYAFDMHFNEDAELEVRPQPIYLLVTPNQVVTVHHGEMAVIHEAQRRWQFGVVQQNPQVTTLLHVILDSVVDSYFPLIDDIGDAVEQVEDKVLEGAQPQQLSQVLQLKRSLLEYRRHVAPAREALNALLRGDFVVLDSANYMLFQDVYDHVLRIVDAIDLHRDLLATVLDVHLSVQSNRLNQVMKVLTMASIILMVNSMVAGIYGMNFRVMPELQWTWGYPFALAVMGVASAVLLWFFRRQGWWGGD